MVIRNAAIAVFRGIFALAFVLVSNANGAEAVRRVGPSIFINGEITVATRDQFNDLLQPLTDTLIITSGGGDSSPAVDIGHQVSRRGLTVVVDQACMSACAHFIFLAAKKKVVRPNSVVIFHNTSSSIVKMVKGSLDPSAARFLLPRKRKEEKLYEELGVPKEMLLQPQIEIRTDCYKYFVGNDGRVQDIKFKGEYQGWIPSPSLLASLGVQVEGFWPKTSGQVTTAYHAVFTREQKPRIIWGGSPALLSAAEIDRRFLTIKECP